MPLDPRSAREACVREVLTALGAGEPERFAACLTPDAEIEDPLTNPIRGSAALDSWLRARRETFPHAAYEPLRIVLREDAGAVEWHARMRDPAGGEHALAGVAMLDFENDRISRLSLYYHARHVDVTHLALAPAWQRPAMDP